MSTQNNPTNPSVKVLVPSTQEIKYYSCLNDALDELDENLENIVTALADLDGFNTLTVPEGSELIIPSGMRLSLDVDATLNILGAFSVADAKAICGGTMVSLYFGNNAKLQGNGLSANSNFYRDGSPAAAAPDTLYHWDVMTEDPFEQAWFAVE